MKFTFEEYTTEHGAKFVKQINDDGTELHIPKVEGNSDYQRYLRWLENPDAEENGTIS